MYDVCVRSTQLLKWPKYTNVNGSRWRLEQVKISWVICVFYLSEIQFVHYFLFANFGRIVRFCHSFASCCIECASIITSSERDYRICFIFFILYNFICSLCHFSILNSNLDLPFRCHFNDVLSIFRSSFFALRNTRRFPGICMLQHLKNRIALNKNGITFNIYLLLIVWTEKCQVFASGDRFLDVDFSLFLLLSRVHFFVWFLFSLPEIGERYWWLPPHNRDDDRCHCCSFTRNLQCLLQFIPSQSICRWFFLKSFFWLLFFFSFLC